MATATTTATTRSSSASTPLARTLYASVGDLTNLGLFAAKPNGDAHRVLVVGDGNFSFARAFLRANTAAIACGAIKVTATSLDTREELQQMYPNSNVILRELLDGGVRVEHGVNATKLQQYPSMLLGSDVTAGSAATTAATPSGLDRIVFNFPHYAEGGSKRNKIHRHRQLLHEFFASAEAVLAPNGLVYVTLCAGQGGTPLDTKPRAPGDTWQVASCAAAAGFVAHDVHLCPVEALAALGYYSVGYKLKEQAFWTPDSLTHVFRREALDQPAAFPLTYSRGLSFWTLAGFSDAKLWAIVRASFPAPIALVLKRTDAYTCPTTGRASATYTLDVSCDRTALSRDRVNTYTLDTLAQIAASDFAASRAT